MALGEWRIFTWKSKKQQEQEQEQYDEWAFPYGKAQQDALQKLLLEVFPKESVATTLIPFLTCKELYDDAFKTIRQEELVAAHMINKIKKYKMIVKKRDMPAYVAFVIADRHIDESLNYPTADEIRAHARELEKLRE
ncbi:MAG: hypothetical protein LBC78_05880 [Oscillospiraceae bacterium]|jgi:hypothetical protein|nr:hypothetical protein [Oscillospiraceae bacterium]